MIGSLKFLLLATVLVGAANSEILSVSDIEICTVLCSKCGGTSTFDNDVCDCRVPDDDEKGAECLWHVTKQQTESLRLDATSADREIVNREARCSLFGSRKQVEKADVDRVVNYFINEGPLTGTPFVGGTRSKCESDDPKIQPTEPRHSANNHPEQVDAKMMDSPVDKSASGSSGENHHNAGFGEPTHTLQSRSLNHHPNLLGAIPNLLLGIPQALLNAATTPGFSGMRYVPYLGAPRQPYFFQTAPNQPFPRSNAAGAFRNINDVISSPYVPVNSHASLVGGRLVEPINPYVGIPNALLAGAQVPSYFPGMVGATHYSPAFRSVESHGGVRSTDNKQTADEGPQSKDSKYFNPPRSEFGASEPILQLERSQEHPSLLHEALAKQNYILEALSQQLASYDPRVGIPNNRHAVPYYYDTLGEPNPTQRCHCNEYRSPRPQSTGLVSERSDRVGESPREVQRIPEESDADKKFPERVINTAAAVESDPIPARDKTEERSGRLGRSVGERKKSAGASYGGAASLVEPKRDSYRSNGDKRGNNVGYTNGGSDGVVVTEPR